MKDTLAHIVGMDDSPRCTESANLKRLQHVFEGYRDHIIHGSEESGCPHLPGTVQAISWQHGIIMAKEDLSSRTEEKLKDALKQFEVFKRRAEEKPPSPTRTGKTVDINGRWDDNLGIEYLGNAHEMTDGTWQCLANWRSSLVLVQVSIHIKEENKGDG